MFTNLAIERGPHIVLLRSQTNAYSQRRPEVSGIFSCTTCASKKGPRQSHEGDPIIKHGTAMENPHCGIDDIPIKKRVAGFNTPLKNMSQLGSLFPIYGNIIQMFQTTNQKMNIPMLKKGIVHFDVGF